MIVDPRTLPIVRSLPILEPGIRLFPERGLHGLGRPLFHWVVQLWMIYDSYALIRKCLTTDHRRVRGGGGAQAPMDGTAVCCARLDDFDWVVPDRVPDILESGRATEEYLSDLRQVEEVLPDVFPVVSAGAAAVPVSLPTLAEVVSLAVFAEEAAPVVAPIAEVETFIVRMVGLIMARIKLPDDSLKSERVIQDFDDVGWVVPGAVSGRICEGGCCADVLACHC